MIYVDHILIIGYFLDMEVKPMKNGCLFLSQTKHVRDVLHKANMHEAGISHDQQLQKQVLDSKWYPSKPSPLLFYYRIYFLLN